MADHTKFTASAAVSIGNARNVRAFFTDAPPPNSFCQLLSEENVELVVAEQSILKLKLPENRWEFQRIFVFHKPKKNLPSLAGFL